MVHFSHEVLNLYCERLLTIVWIPGLEMALAYPLRFEPVFRSYIWGGRRLATVLNKELPEDGRDYAESWEVVDHGDDQSVVANGEMAGKTLSELVSEHGEELLGKHHPQTQFPLLFKFLDCNRNLSVQVHPNDAQGAKLDPPDLGKTEAWVIMSAEPGSCLYAGLREGVDRTELMSHIDAGTVEKALHSIHPSAGDCVFIPAGTVHALGEGLLVAEIQQASNTTFRLFDWNRLGADGKPRPLHVEESLEVTDFARGPIEIAKPKEKGLGVDQLVSCDKFVLERVTITDTHSFGGDGVCHILVVLEGCLQFGDMDLEAGQTVLLPAACDVVPSSSSKAMVLDAHLP